QGVVAVGVHAGRRRTEAEAVDAWMPFRLDVAVGQVEIQALPKLVAEAAERLPGEALGMAVHHAVRQRGRIGERSRHLGPVDPQTGADERMQARLRNEVVDGVAE